MGRESGAETLSCLVAPVASPQQSSELACGRVSQAGVGD